jgi:hypothetical protein
MNKLISVTFNIIGLSSLFATAALGVWVFYSIETTGLFQLCEPRLWVKTGELMLVVFAAVYVVYLIANYLREIT